MLLELTRDNYENEVSSSEIPVLVDIWGPRCIPCLALNPMVEELGNDYEGRVKFAKLNATENRMLCAKMRVIGVFYKVVITTNNRADNFSPSTQFLVDRSTWANGSSLALGHSISHFFSPNAPKELI